MINGIGQLGFDSGHSHVKRPSWPEGRLCAQAPLIGGGWRAEYALLRRSEEKRKGSGEAAGLRGK
jgi:hypothetical protein